MTLRYLSVCSGIESASVAWAPLGWKAYAVAEIETFPCAVLKHHYHDTPNLGDMTEFKDWADAAFDVLVGGTPCQSFSVAGLRKGLADPRGNLALTYLAIADKYRPEWIVWENVPGVLSSGDGRDFGSFLGGIQQLGYGFAYRVFDAQYFGVPQRRRRVFVVGHLGDWRRAAAVLFERESLRRDSPPSREAREGFTHAFASSLTNSGRGVERTGDSRGQDAVVAVPLGCGATAELSDVPSALRASNGGGDKAHVLTSSVRRLTPRECERLQGFPDDYTLVTYRGKPAADGPRYKALGNSMAVPVMSWIGSRIQMVNTIASATHLQAAE